METLVTVHSWVRWLVLVALLAGVVIGLDRYRRRAVWKSGLFQIGVMTIDVQVSIGIVIWIYDDTWSETFFFKVVHPSFMLAALVVAHLGLALAKRRADVRSNLVSGGSFVVTLALIIGAIPWDRL
ncbi:MAG: hypothetical protein U9N84_06510 [Actinomycetota bacterium]|nr:hypothetical protein [Actinomycetota bacterium]